MSKNIRYIFVILIGVLIAFIILISRFYLNVDTSVKKTETETNTNGNYNSTLIVFTDENGLKGVKNSNDTVVLEPVWNSISQIPDKKFIVSQKENQNLRFGIIDIMGSVIVPVIYADITYIQSDRYFVGKTINNGYVLMNTDGSAVIEKEWDDYFKKNPSTALSTVGNYIQLQSGNDIYRIRSIDDELSVFYIGIVRKICGYEREIEIKNINRSVNIKDVPKFYTQVTENAISYVTALFSGDTMQIKKMSLGDNFKELQLDELGIRGGELKYVDYIWPFVEEKDGVITFSCNVSLMYTQPGTIQWDGSYPNTYHAAIFHIIMKIDQNGLLKISQVKAENVDLSQLDIPPECFDPEDRETNLPSPAVTAYAG